MIHGPNTKAKIELGPDYINAAHAFVIVTLRLGLRTPLGRRRSQGLFLGLGAEREPPPPSQGKVPGNEVVGLQNCCQCSIEKQEHEYQKTEQSTEDIACERRPISG